MEPQIKVSVIIPVYNAEKYLRECLGSVVNQTMRALEIICVDDGSTDGSPGILEEYRGKDPRITVLTQENLHAGVARNNGLAVAKGEYVHFLDADDWLEETAYELWYAVALEEDAEVCVCFHWVYDNETGGRTRRRHILKDRYVSISNFETDPYYFLHNTVVPWNKIYRRDFLLNNEVYFDDLICANDRSFYFRVLLNAPRIVILKDYWVNYRKNNQESLIGTKRLMNYDCHFRSFETIWGLVSQCDDATKRIVLDITITDFFNFYHNAIGGGMEQPIREKLRAYLRGMDLSLLGSGIYGYKWYEEYRGLTGAVEPPDVGALRAALEKEIRGLRSRSEESRAESSREIEMLRAEKDGLLGERDRLQAYVGSVQSSRSFRIGRALTSPARKLRSALRHLKDDGIGQTFRLLAKKTGRRPDAEDATADEEPKPVLPWGLCQEERSPRIIVSMTSFPARIGIVHETVKTLLSQTVKPDRLILWLAREQFPGGEEGLPGELLELKGSGLSIGWCEDLRSYKKLVPALKEFPEDIIVTADDDAYYEENWLELLYDSFRRETTMFVHCHRATRLFRPDGEWHYILGSRSKYRQPSYLNKLSGLGGVLYPPHSLHGDVLDVGLFKELAPTNDDVWFWLMAVRNNVKVKIVEGCQPRPKSIEGSQDGQTLFSINEQGGRLFWRDFYCMLEHYPGLSGKLEREYELMRKVERFVAIWERYKTPEFYQAMDPDEYIPAIMGNFYRRVQTYLNLDRPGTFNEKIQWLKIYDSTPLKSRLSDKYEVRTWVQERIGGQYLIPLLGVWNSYNEIDFDSLPESFVLKCTHGCGWNAIVKDKKTMDREALAGSFDRWLNTDFAFVNGLELQYKGIQPRIIAEEYLENNDEELFDYKVWCFNGAPEYIQFLCGRKTGLETAFFDLDWNQLPFVHCYQRGTIDIPKPGSLQEMTDLANVLCQGFPHVRVDFYLLNDGSIRFGEMTFTAASGLQKWDPLEYDMVLGDKIALPEAAPFEGI